MDEKVTLIPLSNNVDYNSLTPSSIKPEIEVSQQEFSENFADTAKSETVDGKLTTTYHDTRTPKSQFMSGSCKVK